jgi:hypothetical protein
MLGPAMFDHAAITVALLGLLGLALGVGALFTLLIRSELHRRKTSLPVPPSPTSAPPMLRSGFRPLFYQQPTRWLAVRAQCPEQVQQALNLLNTAECSWEEGLARGGDRTVFITPPVLGWVLVVGPGLPDPEDDIDDCYHFLVQASRRLDQVQFFSYNPVVSHHAWARLRGGEIERAYAWHGETLWNQGALTRAERELGFTCYDYWEGASDEPGRVEAAGRNVDRLPMLAGRWSINPAGIDERILEHGSGIAGQSTRVRPC